MGGRSRCCTLQFGILLEAADFFQTQKVQVELIVEVRGGVQIILLALLDQELLIYALHLSPFKLSANAASVPSILGGGQHGYLTLTVNPEVYSNLTGNLFTPPTYPRPMPNFVLGMDAAQTSLLEKQHKEQKRMFNEFTSMQNTVKQLLVGAIENTYIISLQHSIVFF